MPTIDEKIKATEFTASTTLTFDDIVAIGDTIAITAGNLGTSVKRASIVDGTRIEYRITRLGTVGVGALTVTYARQGDAAVVTFAVPDYLVSQTTLLYLIPVGPKESPALPVARAFSQKLRAALSS